MSRVAPVQSSFNGGELSQRLQARVDQSIREIAVAQMLGWVPLMEGGAEACPGLIHVAAAKGPCRLLPFEYNVTQGHVLEFSEGAVRVFTNDGQIESAPDVPLEVESPYNFEQIGALSIEQSYDVLYLFHRDAQTRQFARTGPDSFVMETVDFLNGPFEARNKDEGLVVSASGVSGPVTLTATQPIFEAGDVGGLFRLEADDFGSIPSWEPGITVTNGKLLTWAERVYRVAGGSGRTGTVAPIHSEGVEWDGIGSGKDVNDTDAGGVQLEYIHDRIGLLKITGFASETEVQADVTRRLPFTASTAAPVYRGGYYDESWTDPEAPAGSLGNYAYGTWRWRFGSFSDRRGWPSCGVIWNERLVMAKDSTIYGSVAGDLLDHNAYNELGEISTDQAFIYTLKDPNPIVALVDQEKLLALTANGVHALGGSNAASGIGPGNLRADRQNSAGAAAAMTALVDGRCIYLGKSRRRLFEGDNELQRGSEQATDLTRYARHIGNSRFVAIASQKEPQRLLWGVREDGTLAAAAYVPEEQVLGWCRRTLGGSAQARSIASISDPTGELEQLWVACEFKGGWHVLRMAQFRADGVIEDTPVMLDMAFEYEGDPATSFSASWLKGETVELVADNRWLGPVTCDAETGGFTIAVPASRVVAGYAYPAQLQTLKLEAGGDNGPALTKTQRIGRVALSVLQSQGLSLQGSGGIEQSLELLAGGSVADGAFPSFSGVFEIEQASDYSKDARLTIERKAPFAATVMAVQPVVETKR